MKKNFYDAHLKGHPYSQCGVVIDKIHGAIHFYSYNTRVISITADGWMICTGTYTATTRKQIGWFLREYAPTMNYYNAKQIYHDNMMINVHTGEVLPLLI